jgi:hypothetical protein
MHPVKPHVILITALLGTICIGCGQTGNPTRSPANAERAADASDVVRTGDATIIKKSGWRLPVSLPEEKHYTETIVIIDGRPVKVSNSPFFPAEKLLVTIPKFREAGDVEYNIIQILEFVDERKKPYCYQFVGSDPAYEPSNIPPGRTVVFSYRDDDGDGVFETLSDGGCSVPAWVK